MVENAKNRQLISLTEALAILDRIVEPVAPAERDLSAALGYTLAADAGPDNAKRLTGARLRRIDIALLASFKVESVAVRMPRVLVVRTGKPNNNADAVCTLIAGAIDGEGGIASTEAKPLDAALNNEDCHAVIAIGGDANLRTLADAGRVEFDGVALDPVGSIAFGNANARPVLAV